MVCRPVADVVWVSYLAVFVGTIVKRSEPHIYVANWFFLSFIITIAMLHLVNNLAAGELPRREELFRLLRRAGCADAVVVRPQRGRLLPHRRLPRDDVLFRAEAGRAAGLFSYRLSIIHFWSLIFLYIWAGPHHLHYTALPDWAQTLGMVFSVMLWMPSWGGMINGLMTLNGAWDKIRTDPIIRMMVMALAFYGMSTFEGPMMSHQEREQPLALYGLDHRPRS
jgi:cytochrome c oxidase cbb3-type subunit 1